MATAVCKIINSTYITLDGIIQNPQDWPSMGGVSDAGGSVQTDFLGRCDASTTSPRATLPIASHGKRR